MIKLKLRHQEFNLEVLTKIYDKINEIINTNDVDDTTFVVEPKTLWCERNGERKLEVAYFINYRKRVFDTWHNDFEILYLNN